MNQKEISQEIQFIKEMVEKTKKSTAESWLFFSIWGIVIILGIIGNYTLVLMEKYSFIWVNWILFMGCGAAFSILFHARREKAEKTQTYAGIATGHLTFACGIGFAMGGFVFPLLGLYSYEIIPVIIATIAGILFFVLGGIYEWNLLKFSAALWWLGAVGMTFVHWHFRALLCVPLIIFGYLVPGFILKSQYQKEKNTSGS